MMYRPSSGRKDFNRLDPGENKTDKEAARPMMRMIHSSSGRDCFGVASPSARPTLTMDFSSAPPATRAAMLAPSSGRQGFRAFSSTPSSNSSSMVFTMAHPSSGRQDFNSTLPQPAWQPPHRANSGTGGGSASAAGHVRHESITCDVCGVSPIVGVRYRCTVCPDYDVCGLCVDHAPPTSLSGVAPNGHDRDTHYYLRIRESTPQVHDTVAANATRPIEKPSLV